MLGPVVGAYGGGSSDLVKLRDLAAAELARKHVGYYSMPLSRARGMFKRQLNREWGHHIARGWATLIHDRLRDYVGVDECDDHAPADEHYFGPDSGTAHAQWAHNINHPQRTHNNPHIQGT